MYITTKALVLRETKYKEADKILTVLTENEGKFTVKARGAYRKGCKFSSASQVLCFSEMTLFGNKGKWSLNEATVIEQFLPLREDIGKLALGTYFSEMLEAVTDEDCPSPELLQLGLNSLFALSYTKYSQEHIKSVFEMKLMCLSGYEPQIDACPNCGEVPPAEPMFSLSGGCVHCRKCPPGTPGISMPVSKETFDAIRYIVFSDPKKIFSFTIPEEAERQLGSITEAFSMTQLERGFRALDYWKSINITK